MSENMPRKEAAVLKSALRPKSVDPLVRRFIQCRNSLLLPEIEEAAGVVAGNFACIIPSVSQAEELGKADLERLFDLCVLAENAGERYSLMTLSQSGRKEAEDSAERHGFPKTQEGVLLQIALYNALKERIQDLKEEAENLSGMLSNAPAGIFEEVKRLRNAFDKVEEPLLIKIEANKAIRKSAISDREKLRLLAESVDALQRIFDFLVDIVAQFRTFEVSRR